jgi:hypothetical protein
MVTYSRSRSSRRLLRGPTLLALLLLHRAFHPPTSQHPLNALNPQIMSCALTPTERLTLSMWSSTTATQSRTWRWRRWRCGKRQAVALQQQHQQLQKLRSNRMTMMKCMRWRRGRGRRREQRCSMAGSYPSGVHLSKVKGMERRRCRRSHLRQQQQLQQRRRTAMSRMSHLKTWKMSHLSMQG